jgi:hypothetical protein
VLEGAKRRAATQIWPRGIFARATLSAIISSRDEGTVPLHIKGDVVIVPTTIAILGGYSVTGRALEALLQGIGYDTRLIEDPPDRPPEQLLEGVRLLLLAPTLNSESRETLLAEMDSTLEVASIPVLTLSTTLKESPGDGPAFIPWPCRLEVLTKKIEAALLRVPEVHV